MYEDYLFWERVQEEEKKERVKRSNNMKIYTAGSISGKTREEVEKYFSDLRAELEGYGFTVFNPMLGKAMLRVNERYLQPRGVPVATDRAIIGRSRWMVGQADVVYVNLAEAAIVSIGSMIEMAWAYELRKHVVAVIPEGNIHEHAFPLMAADIRFYTTEEALAYLKEIGESVNKLVIEKLD